MTARKSVKKKAKKKHDSITYDIYETHAGKVSTAFQDHLTRFWARRVVTRDAAVLMAMELLVASGGLSRAEVAKHFSK